jgi:putative RNA 2'-phosphotransferase
MNDHDLSRAISHALRHEPWLYELEIDDEGWTSLSRLIEALRRTQPAWQSLGRRDVERMIAKADKRRHEMVGDRIRALYGHSLPGKLIKEPAEPPAALFHGTSEEAAPEIRRDGLKPMNRQYVHLSADRRTAEQVGRRKGSAVVIFEVDALAATAAGVTFYRGNEKVWLADVVPPMFLATSR